MARSSTASRERRPTARRRALFRAFHGQPEELESRALLTPVSARPSLIVDQPPAITSVDNTAFTAATFNTFTVTTTGTPTPAIAETAPLPGGVTFVDNGDGTATLSGTPATGSGGIYDLLIAASNGVGNDAFQSFTLTVNESPTFTTGRDQTTFATGEPNLFTFTTLGFPTPALSETGNLPSGVSFMDNGDGTASLFGTPAAGTGGSYVLLITAANGIGAQASQNFTLNVVEATPPDVFPPGVLSLRRFGYHTAPTNIILSFDQPMNASSTEQTSNYFIQPVSRGTVIKAARQVIRVTSAIYNPGNQTVTLTPARQLNLHRIYVITANAQAPNGLANQYGVLLDGTGHGVPGRNFVFKFAGLPSLANIPGPGQAHPIGTRPPRASTQARPDAAGAGRIIAHFAPGRNMREASRNDKVGPFPFHSLAVRRGVFDARTFSANT
jgi:hypothetical protein